MKIIIYKKNIREHLSKAGIEILDLPEYEELIVNKKWHIDAND